MIDYSNSGVFRICQLRGSVFPKSILVSVPCAVLAAILKLYILQGGLHEMDFLSDSGPWSGFSFLVGFLIVFRTSQAYIRFWDGCTTVHQMRAEWFDACSCLVAFCKHSTVGEAKISTFQNTIVRLCSMLHASALADLEEINQLTCDTGDIRAFTFDLIDPGGIDERSLQVLKHSTCRVELVFSWIQMLIVENIGTGVLSIPPPILSRAFQEIANGMVAFQDALKITYIPFPFPYAQTCDSLLLVHWILTPVVTAQWVSSPIWAGAFASIQVFILWSLNWIAVEIENPFGRDENDLDGQSMQREMNHHLLLLLHRDTARTPVLTATACKIEDCGMAGTNIRSFHDVWNDLGDPVSAAASAAETLRRSVVSAVACGSVKRSSSGDMGRFSNRSPSKNLSGAIARSARASEDLERPPARSASRDLSGATTSNARTSKEKEGSRSVTRSCEEAGYVLSEWQAVPKQSIMSIPESVTPGFHSAKVEEALKSDTADGGWSPLSPVPLGGPREPEEGHPEMVASDLDPLRATQASDLDPLRPAQARRGGTADGDLDPSSRAPPGGPREQEERHGSCGGRGTDGVREVRTHH